ncbi:MAG: serpin family protein [Candidatus Bipolaricaulaceae bacterium]
MLLVVFVIIGVGLRFLEAKKGSDVPPPTDHADPSQALVAGNTAFAFDLYQAIRESPGNLFYSPYSISLALAMTYAGARGETGRQMARTLRFTLPEDVLHPAFGALSRELAGSTQEGFEVHIVNALWVQTGYLFLPGFVRLLAENYGTTPRDLDFVRSPGDACRAINDWVSKETKGRIQDLLPPGSCTSSTRMVLTNAVYFKAAWLFPFDSRLTRDEPFHLLDGKKVMVPMMRQEGWLRYGTYGGCQAIELPYQGRGASLVVLLPPVGKFQVFERGLDAGFFAKVLDSLSSVRVRLLMPKFSYEAQLFLGGTLARMGMPDAFTPAGADFSGIDGSRNLFLSEVVHKAFVALDEAGIEAAAATAVIATAASPFQPEVVEMRIDRPFIFVIRDNRRGTILFVGRVLDPR